MTTMQLNYAKHLEQVQHDRATEALTAADVETRRGTLEETVKHNRVTEALSAKQLDETIRHQLAQDTETMRNHLVTEKEIARHNRNTETLMKQENEIKVATANLNAAIQQYKINTDFSLNKYLGELSAAVSKYQTYARYLTDSENIKVQWAKVANEITRIENDYDLGNQKIDLDRINNFNSLMYTALDTVGAAIKSDAEYFSKANAKSNALQGTLEYAATQDVDTYSRLRAKGLIPRNEEIENSNAYKHPARKKTVK